MVRILDAIINVRPMNNLDLGRARQNKVSFQLQMG